MAGVAGGVLVGPPLAGYFSSVFSPSFIFYVIAMILLTDIIVLAFTNSFYRYKLVGWPDDSGEYEKLGEFVDRIYMLAC